MLNAEEAKKLTNDAIRRASESDEFKHAIEQIDKLVRSLADVGWSVASGRIDSLAANPNGKITYVTLRAIQAELESKGFTWTEMAQVNYGGSVDMYEVSWK